MSGKPKIKKDRICTIAEIITMTAKELGCSRSKATDLVFESLLSGALQFTTFSEGPQPSDTIN